MELFSYRFDYNFVLYFDMSKFKKGTKPNQSIVKLLESLKMPIYDKEHNLYIFLERKQEVTRRE